MRGPAAFRSLRGRLFVLLILPLVVVAAAASFARYKVAESLSRELYDNTLLVVALTISRDVVLSGGDVLTETLLTDLTTALGDPVFYRITGPRGGFVTGYSDSPDRPAGLQPADGRPVFFDSVAQGRPVRVVVLDEVISQSRFTGRVTVEVWQTLTQRQALSRELLMQSVALLGSILLTAALIVWFGIQLGLKPLLDLRDAIGIRNPDDLRPIRRWVPPELKPLVNTTNSLFDRLSQAFAQRDAFISDAAHQMRNPVAAMQTQAEAALTAPDEAELRSRVAGLALTAQATSRLTSQLLSLERVKGRGLKAMAQRTDLVALLRGKVLPFAEAQLRRGVDVGFSVTGTPRAVDCDPVLIEEMVVNLLDNAGKYGLSPGGTLEVALEFLPDEVVLQVIDDGPGIPASLRERVFDRFYRIDTDQSRGCGLGLAIVADVAKHHGGTAHVVPTDSGCAFAVRMSI